MTIRRVTFPSVSTLRQRLSVDMVLQILLVLLALLAVLPSFFALRAGPDTDSGLFLYFATEMLDGRIPYRDFWVNHPPLIFVINLVGLAAGGQFTAGVWVLEFIALAVTALLLYRLLTRYFGRVATSLGIAGLLANYIFVYAFGNYPQAYALPLQAAVLLLLADSLDHPGLDWRPFAIGILLGLLFSINISLSGTALFVALCVLAVSIANKAWSRLLHLSLTGLGFVVVWAGWAVYFAWNQALPQLWDQVFRYPLLLSGVSHFDRIAAFLDGIQYLYRSSGFFGASFLTWLIVLPFLYFNERRFRQAITGRSVGAFWLLGGFVLILNGIYDDNNGRFYALSALTTYRLGLIAGGLALLGAAAFFLGGYIQRWSSRFSAGFTEGVFPGLLFPLAFALIDLPAQLVSASFLGCQGEHCYLPMLPAMSILVAFMAWSIWSRRNLADPSVSILAVAWLVVLTLPVLFTGFYTMLEGRSPQYRSEFRTAVNEIQQLSGPQETILQWGENGQLHFASGRKSASRYLSQQPLFNPRYAGEDKIDRMLAELNASPPALIIDTRTKRMPLVVVEQESCDRLDDPELVRNLIREERDRRFYSEREDPLPFVPMEMNQAYRWICARYDPVSPVYGDDLNAWRIYRLRSTQP